MPTASAIILSYARVNNLSSILDSLLILPFLDDIVVWHNGPRRLTLADIGVVDSASRVVLVNCQENKYTWGRFCACQIVKHRAVLTQDDDVLVKNWPDIFAAWKPESVAAALRIGHLRQDSRYHWGQSHEVLLGWGSVFDSRMVSAIFQSYIDHYGRDHVLYRKADRLFTILHNRPHSILKANFVELEGANDVAVALYARDDHERLTHIARRRALALLGITYAD